MKKIIYYFIISIFLTLMGCSNEQETLRVGYIKWPGYEPLVLAKEKKFFDQAGITIKTYYFSSLHDVMNAYSEGKIDIIFSTTTEVLFLKNKGEKLKIVLVVDYSNGADAIIARPKIRSIADLKNQTLALESGSISHFLLLNALHKYNLKEEDITILNTSGEEGEKMFEKHKVNAIVTWPPFSLQAIKAGGHVIYSSTDLPGEIVDTIAIRESFLDNHPEESLKFISVYLNTVEWLKQHFEEGSHIINQSYQLNNETFQDDIKNIQLTGVKENSIALGTPEKKGNLYAALNKFMQFCLEKKLISDPIDTNELIDPRLFWKYKQSDENSQ